MSKDQKNLSDYDVKYLLKRFYKDYLRFNFKSYLPVQLAHVIGASLSLIPPLILRSLIDDAIPAQNIDKIIRLSLQALGIFILIVLIRTYKNYYGHKVAQSIVFDMRNDLYDHFQDLSMNFHDDKKTGELMSRIVDDLNRAQEFIHHGPEAVMTSGVKVIGVIIILSTLDISLTGVSMSFAPLLLLYAWYMVKGMHKAFRKNREEKANLQDRLEDNLAGIKIIKAFANEKFEKERFSKRNRDHFNARLKAIKYISVLGPGAYLLNSIGLVASLGFGGFLVTQGELTAGTIIAFYTYLLNFRGPILRLIRINQGLSRFLASMERYFSHIDIKPAIDTSEEPERKEEKLSGEIEFKNVSFSYEEQEEVLNNININIKPREMVALVGPSGAGKTTIVRLITRMYDADEGKVKVDGVNVKNWDLDDLRNSTATVMQDDYLFSGTIKDNISYGAPNALENQIINVAKKANVDEFVKKMPDGYETEIGQRGVRLSGGQRQRISIARALLKDPEILILDEATSSVDTHTEKLIQEAIDEVSKGRTTVTIAHRLSTIVNADKILFIEEGKIKERGNFKQLMKKEEKFKEFYEHQFHMEKPKK